MGNYTESMALWQYEISPEDEDYAAKLIEVASHFRNMDEVVDEFMLLKGYEGGDDIASKAAFLREKFRSAGVPEPRGMKDWFLLHKRFDRRTAFLLCFALGLDTQETSLFFKKCFLGRSFDCHVSREAVYYYCFLNNLTYKDAERILEQTGDIRQGRIDFGKEILYTQTIRNEIEHCTDTDQLIAFLKANAGAFEYNNASAYRFVRELWRQIAEKNGLASTERSLFIYADYNEPYVSLETEELSLEKVYWQILGLDEDMVSKVRPSRSLKSIIKNNALMHPAAEDAFPDRNGIQNILSGRRTSYDNVRKILILLVFYRFWVKRAIRRRDGMYASADTDADECLGQINHYLADAGYTELYYGNPYDWIFLFAMYDEYPLPTFREYIAELFHQKAGG